MDIVVFRQANCFALERADADAVERVRRALAPQYALGGPRRCGTIIESRRMTDRGDA